MHGKLEGRFLGVSVWFAYNIGIVVVWEIAKMINARFT